MNEWLSFVGRVEPMEWGNSTFTILTLPEEIVLELARRNTRRVEIELNDHPFNMALTKAPAVSGAFVYTGKSILQEVGISPGDEIEVRLRKADPNMVDVPSDVLLAIHSANLAGAWASLTPGKQRGMLHQITSAKKQETRVRRIEQLLASLRG